MRATSRRLTVAATPRGRFPLSGGRQDSPTSRALSTLRGGSGEPGSSAANRSPFGRSRPALHAFKALSEAFKTPERRLHSRGRVLGLGRARACLAWKLARAGADCGTPHPAPRDRHGDVSPIDRSRRAPAGDRATQPRLVVWAEVPLCRSPPAANRRSCVFGPARQSPDRGSNCAGVRRAAGVPAAETLSVARAPVS